MKFTGIRIRKGTEIEGKGGQRTVAVWDICTSKGRFLVFCFPCSGHLQGPSSISKPHGDGELCLRVGGLMEADPGHPQWGREHAG